MSSYLKNSSCKNFLGSLYILILINIDEFIKEAPNNLNNFHKYFLSIRLMYWNCIRTDINKYKINTLDI